MFVGVVASGLVFMTVFTCCFVCTSPSTYGWSEGANCENGVTYTLQGPPRSFTYIASALAVEISFANLSLQHVE